METATEVQTFPSFSTIAIAINGSKKSKLTVKWAMEKFIPEGNVLFKLIYVREKCLTISSSSNTLDMDSSANKRDIENQTNEILHPYKQMLSKRKVSEVMFDCISLFSLKKMIAKKMPLYMQVDAEAVVIEAYDVAKAIWEEITKYKIKKLVIGSSSRNKITRKFKGENLSARITQFVSDICTVFIVSKGKLLSVQTPRSNTIKISPPKRSDSFACSSMNSSLSDTNPNTGRPITYSRFHQSSLLDQRHRALSTINQRISCTRSNSFDFQPYSPLSLNIEDEESTSGSSRSETEYASSSTSNSEMFSSNRHSWTSEKHVLTPYDPMELSLPENQIDVTFEVEKLRIELQLVRKMYAMAENESRVTTTKLKELSERRMEERKKLKEICAREEKTSEKTKELMKRNESARKEAELLLICAGEEEIQREIAEKKAAKEAEERKNLERSLDYFNQNYETFTWDEIVLATSSFSDEFKIGQGGFGTVYKCKLRHAIVAVKLLNQREGNLTNIEKEIEILRKTRHPHLLLLLGACPDHGCLIYEYMENGNLEDRIFRRNNAPPLPWFDRFRIAWEVASALVFLHDSKPNPIVHRDLKPSNILLDHNLVSKIGDVGLSSILPSHHSMSSVYKDTSPVGTFFYIDPEYQRTGMVSPKSDLYAFGIVVLQLLTSKPPMGLAHIIESALEGDRFEEILDNTAGNWPNEETRQLAIMALKCTELKRNERPDLNRHVLPLLDSLKIMACRAKNLSTGGGEPSPHFICPILQAVMEDPYVAADGCTYDRKAIQSWFRSNDTSPTTNLILPHKNLTPNYSLLSAITEWKAKNNK